MLSSHGLFSGELNSKERNYREATMNLRVPKSLITVVLVVLCAACARADVMSSSNPALVGQSVTFTIQIEAPTGVTAIPTGTVTFTDGGQSIGTVTLQNGIASFTTQFGSPGDHVIVAEYSGDANFQPASTPPFLQHVTADDLFTISVSPSMLSQRTGASSDVGLTLFSNDSSAAPVHFDCEDLPPGVACSFQSNAVVPTANGTGTAMTVTSTGTVRADQRAFPRVFYAGLFIPVLFVRRRRSVLALCALVPLFLAGCGGHVRVINGGTPPGSYSIHVVASDGTTTQRAPIRLNIL